MRILFISDIHGSLFFLEKIKEEFNISDKILILGDYMYHGPRNPLPNGYNPKGVADFLNNYKNKIIGIRGNCDSEVDQMLLEFPMMNDYSIFYTEDTTFFLTHGHIFSPENHINLNPKTIFCSGHTHIPMLEEKNKIIYFNCGSLSLPKGTIQKSSFGLYENKNLHIKYID